MSHFINKVVLWDHHEILMLTLTPTLHPSESSEPLEMEICTSQLNHTNFWKAFKILSLSEMFSSGQKVVSFL